MAPPTPTSDDRLRSLEHANATLLGSLRTIKFLLSASLATGLIAAGWFASTTITTAARVDHLERIQERWDVVNRERLARIEKRLDVHGHR